tara:strand:+ start:77 stop:991 length:915 start_codon:yes stop_codon:yes gene_type:complete
MNKHQNSIIVTGATGYIGSSFLKFINEKNIYIRTFGRKKFKDFDNKYFNFQNMNISDEDIKGFKYLIHFASISHTNIKDDTVAKRNILEPTIFLAEKAIKNNLKKFIYISSVKSIDVIKTDNEFKKNKLFHDIYSKYKKITEKKLLNLFNGLETKLIIIRPALVYGGNEKGNLKILTTYIKNSPLVLLPYINNNKSMVHLENLIQSINLITFDDNIKENQFNILDRCNYSFVDICNAINLKFNRKIYFIKIPNFLVIILFKIESLLKLNFLRKIFVNEIYPRSNIEKYGFKQKKDISNLYEESH